MTVPTLRSSTDNDHFIHVFDNFQFFCSKLSLGIDFSFPSIPDMQLFSVNKYEQNREHHFQVRTYMQQVEIFSVAFFLSAFLHAEEP